MPAKSKAQQEYMAIAEHAPSKLKGPAPKMSYTQLHDFAATPRKGLPQHVATPRAHASKHHAQAGKLRALGGRQT